MAWSSGVVEWASDVVEWSSGGVGSASGVGEWSIGGVEEFNEATNLVGKPTKSGFL